MFVKALVAVKWISEDEFKMVLVRLSDSAVGLDNSVDG